MAGAAGFTVLLLVGLRDAATVNVGVTCSLAARRMLEGDRVDIAIELDHRTGDQIDLAIHSGTGAIRPVHERSPVVDDTTVGDERSTSRFVTAAYDTIRWGRFDVGLLALRASRPGCLATWEGSLWDLGPLVVLPKQERLDQLLAPRASHATAGSHPARRFSGDGTDFVDIRPYLPGDRLRDLNWRATARQHSPQINRRMPERGGDVVIVLDALIDGYWTETEVGDALVQRSGQAVWALVRNHLAAQDRVGLLAQSSQSLGWIPPSGGTRARYKVLETLLSATRPGSDQRSAAAIASPDAARHSSVSARDRRLVVGKRRGVAITRIAARSRPSRLCAGDRQHRHDRGNRPTRPGTAPAGRTRVPGSRGIPPPTRHTRGGLASGAGPRPSGTQARRRDEAHDPTGDGAMTDRTGETTSSSPTQASPAGTDLWVLRIQTLLAFSVSLVLIALDGTAARGAVLVLGGLAILLVIASLVSSEFPVWLPGSIMVGAAVIAVFANDDFAVLALVSLAPTVAGVELATACEHARLDRGMLAPRFDPTHLVLLIVPCDRGRCPRRDHRRRPARGAGSGPWPPLRRSCSSRGCLRRAAPSDSRRSAPTPECGSRNLAATAPPRTGRPANGRALRPIERRAARAGGRSPRHGAWPRTRSGVRQTLRASPPRGSG